jgi:hypothetical protein
MPHKCEKCNGEGHFCDAVYRENEIRGEAVLQSCPDCHRLGYVFTPKYERPKFGLAREA